jgi:pilus assembly protein CpaE
MRSVLEIAAPIERTARTSAGRAPLLAFVADAETERVMRDNLGELGFAEATIIRGGISKAIDVLGTQRSPDLLIVDITGDELPVSRIHDLAEVCEPGVTVVAIGDRNEIGLYRDLLHAGVNDYIVKPLTAQLVARVLTAKTNPGEVGTIQRRVGTMVAIVGARGGVGTTTIAVNLAWYLANQQNRRVALLDLDVHNGNCAMALNVKATPGLREALVSPTRIDNTLLDRVMSPVGDRLFVLSAEEPLRDSVDFTVDAVETLVALSAGARHGGFPRRRRRRNLALGA